MTKDESTKPASSSSSRWFPGWGGRIAIAICLLVIVALRTIQPWDATPFPLSDKALANILTLIFSFIAALTLWSWFCFQSGFSRLVRMIVLTATAMLAVLFAVSIVLGQLQLPTPVRYAGVDGTMVPRFEAGWRPAIEQTVGGLETKDRPAADLATATAEDFPQFLGPQRSAHVTGPKLSRDWKAQPPKLLWRRPIGAGWSGFAAVNGYAVTLEQRGSSEWVTCYEVATGEPAWGHEIAARHDNPLGGLGPRSTPTIHQGRVYALGASGVLRCLDGKDGKQLWSDDLRKRYFGDAPDRDALDEALVQWGRAASPLIVDDLVVVPAGGPPGKTRSLIAFRAETGDVAWEGGDEQISYASPALATIAGVRQILIVNEATVSGHAPASGEPLWRHPWPGHSYQDANSSQAVALPGDRVLLSKGYGGGAEMLQLAKTADGAWQVSTDWRNRKVLETKFTNVVVLGEHVFGLSNGILECVNLESGRKQWKQGRYGHGQILGVGELILVQAEPGDLALVEANPDKFVELGRVDALDSKTWNNLCLFGNKLLVRNDREAACFELP
jgi:outer membrane protein assembly factor BamB